MPDLVIDTPVLLQGYEFNGYAKAVVLGDVQNCAFELFSILLRSA